MAKKILTPLEIENKARKKAAKEDKKRHTNKVFFELLGSANIAPPEIEHIFHNERKWRLDYAWPEKKIALEVEGGVFTGGRHTSGIGFMGDMEKYNQAVLYGWRIIRTTPSNLLKTGTLDLIRQIYNQ